YYSLTRQVPRPILALSTPEVRLPRPADIPPIKKQTKKQAGDRAGLFYSSRFDPPPIGHPIAALCAIGPDGRT
ncbi:MAG: hypothetical protein OXH64_12690, partial [Rhodospirillaceae bacterium]|nr:hypothetical protein [Rhodospirillaceae bacterium]